MTTEADATIQVATIDMRKALQAVAPHAEKNKTGDNAVEHRVRLSFDASEVYVMATNGHTTGLAVVPIQDDSRSVRFAVDDGPFWVDLSPRHVKLILQFFTESTGSGTDMNEMLELKATTTSLTIRDVGGLWAGEGVTLEQLEFDTDFPNIIGMLTPALAEAGSTPAGKYLVTPASLLKLFAGAGKAYAEPLVIKPTGTDSSRGFLVEVGSRFVGTVESRHLDDDGLKNRDKAHMRWLDRFPAKKLTAVSN